MRADDLPLRYNAVELLERNLPARAGEPALLSAARCVTYGGLSAEVNRVGNALLELGLREGDVVAILCPDSVEWVAAFFGTLKIGAVALGLNTLLTPKDYAYIVADARARAIVVHRDLGSSLAEVAPPWRGRRPWIVVGDDAPGGDDEHAYGALVDAASPELEAAPTHREDFCALNYSSGTTGEPKGILHAHQDLPLSAKLWAVDVLGLTAADRTFSAAKLFFTFGLGGNLVFPFAVGASSVLLAGPPRVPANVIGALERFRPTILYHAPTGYAGLLAVEGFPSGDQVASLRLCVSAGESLPAPLWHAWKEATGLDILDGLGSTENFHIFLSNRPGDIRPGSSGKPFPGYELRLVDHAGHPVAAGEVGNLWVRGETAALAYLHKARATRATFRGEWMVTGDQYRVDEDGYYWHAGRTDDMLKVGGIWVSPVEVESTLLEHEAVLECAVVGYRDSADLVKPRAYVQLRPGVTRTPALADELVAHCKARMADYKRPRQVEFVDDLPRTATGKIQRFRLRGD